MFSIIAIKLCKGAGLKIKEKVFMQILLFSDLCNLSLDFVLGCSEESVHLFKGIPRGVPNGTLGVW